MSPAEADFRDIVTQHLKLLCDHPPLHKAMADKSGAKNTPLFLKRYIFTEGRLSDSFFATNGSK